jgi:phage shock protein PspC (stress-responsive transcriptional regulator)
MTETLTYKQLRRSRSDRMVAGVSGGLGRYFDVNPVLYRVGFVVLALLGGAGIIIYAAAALVIPDEGRDESIVEQAIRERRRRPWQLIGLALVFVSAVVLLSELHFWHGRFGWLLVLVSGIVLLLLGPRLWHEVTTPPPAPPAPPVGPNEAIAATAPPPPSPPRWSSFPLRSVVLGVLLVGAAVLAIVAAGGVDVPWAIALAVAAGVVGVAVIAGALLHMRVRGLVLIGIVLGAAAILASTINLHLGDGIGDRHYAPVTAEALRGNYRLGVGELELDLSKLRLPPGRTTVTASLGVGHMLVTVPRDAAVRVDSHVDWGDSDVLGVEDNGREVDNDVSRPGRPGAPLLVLDADVGAGQLEVVRAVR